MVERDKRNPDEGRHEMEAIRLFELIGHLSLRAKGQKDTIVTFVKQGNGTYKISGVQNGVEMFGSSSNVSAVDAYSGIPPQDRRRISARLDEIDQELTRRRKKR